MHPALKVTWRSIQLGFAAIAGFLTWTLWLALVLLLAGQLWLLSTKEIPVPGYLQTAMRERLANSQLDASFARARFDPAGHVLIQDVRIGSTGFTDPFVTAEAIYVVLDPWALAVGSFEPREIRATGVTFLVPAMFSASGRPEPVIGGVDVTLRARARELEIAQFNARIGRLQLTAHGTVPIADWRTGQAPSLPLSNFLSRQYPRLSREFATLVARLEVFEQPALDLEVSPAGPQRVTVAAAFRAASARLAQPVAAQATRLQASTRVVLGGSDPFPAELAVTAATLGLPYGVQLDEASVVLTGRARPRERDFVPVHARLGAVRATAPAVAAPASALWAELALARDDVPLSGSVQARIAGTPVAVEGQADPTRKTASLEVAGAVTAELVGIVAGILGRPLDPWVAVNEPVPLEARVRLEPGWQLGEVEGRLDARDLRVRNVDLAQARAHVRFAGTTLVADDILLRLGANAARGSYAMDTSTLDYRFLLAGRVRPPEIAPWFGAWWPRFFGNFEFPSAPDADADIRGRWRQARSTSVFVGVDAADVVVKGAAFDRVRTSVFSRPGHVDVRAFRGTRGPTEATGAFTRTASLENGQLRSLDFDVVSSLDLAVAPLLFGDAGAAVVAPFRFEQPPRLKLSGRFDGPAAPAGVHRTARIEGSSSGVMELLGFPVSNPVFTAQVNDDVIDIPRVEMDVAAGRATGSARLTGRDASQRLRFDAALKGAKLGPAVTTLTRYLARRAGQPPPEAGAYLAKAGDTQLDVTLAAEGSSRDVRSFTGAGHAELAGPDLGEVKMFGGLSDLLTFSALRFTRAQSDFRVEREKLNFPELRLTGANSAILAGGTYTLGARDPLDFRVKVYPFEESGGLLQVVGALLTPLSEFLEVRLTGSLATPTWAFVSGPTNLLRSLAAPVPATAEPDATAPTAPGPGQAQPTPPAAASPPSAPDLTIP